MTRPCVTDHVFNGNSVCMCGAFRWSLLDAVLGRPMMPNHLEGGDVVKKKPKGKGKNKKKC